MTSRRRCALAVPVVLALAACGGGGGGGTAGNPCTYAIDPSSASPGPAPASGSVSVTAGAGCAWTAASDRPWAQITSPASGTGNGTVSFDVSGNASTASRSATLTIAGLPFSIVQGGDALAVSAVSPPSATRLETTTVTVTGSAIASGATVALSSCSGAEAYDLTAAVAAVGGASITATLDASPSLVPGVYSVTVTNPSGLAATASCALRIVADPRPTVTSVSPAVAFAGIPGDGAVSDPLVTIRGTGFAAAPRVTWARVGAAGTHDAPFVGFVSDTEITARVPAESGAMAPGDYHVWVTNPDLLDARWNVGGGAPGVFGVTLAPPPRIDGLTPARVEVGSCTITSIEIAGSGFHPAAQAFHQIPGEVACAGGFVSGGSTLCPLVTDAVPAGGLSMTVHLDPCPGAGAYPVVVRNPDGQAASFDALQVTPSADGHLNQGAFATLPSTLATPRFKHGAATAFDPAGRAFLYVAGGEGAGGQVLSSVELARLDVQGNLTPFARALQAAADGTRVPNDLRGQREGLALVSAGRALLAIGGADAPTSGLNPVAATSSVERARILGDEEVPAVPIPLAALPLPWPGGEPPPALPAGAWYYQVSALGPWGEGLPSPEVLGRNPPGGTMHVCWTAPSAPGVTGYDVYRSLAADGRTGTTTLLARNVPGPCLDDDGQGTLAPAPARLRAAVAPGGSLVAGTYRYRVSALVPDGGGTLETHASYEASVEITALDVNAGNAAAGLRWDPMPAATAYVVRRFDPVAQEFDAVLTTTATALVDGGLPFGGVASPPRVAIPPLPPGSLSRWEELDAGRWLVSPREGADAVSVALDPSLAGTLAARVFVAGGRPRNADPPLATVESLGVFDDGSLEAGWTVEASTLATGRSYLSLATTQRRNDTGFRPPLPPSSADPEWLVAVFGRDGAGNRIISLEACAIDTSGAGHLACGPIWTTQANVDSTGAFGAGATFSYGYLYAFRGVDRETGGIPVIQGGSAARWSLDPFLPTPPGSSILAARQSMSATFAASRGYYRLLRGMGSAYAVGGWTGAAPTATVERHDE